MGEKLGHFRGSARRAKVWRNIKRRFHHERLWGREQVRFSTYSGPWRVAVEVTGRAGFRVVTELRTQIRDPHELRLTIHRSDWLTELIKRFAGTQDIQIGDPELDERFEIHGSDVERVLRFMDNPVLRRALRNAPACGVELGPSVEDHFFKRVSGISQLTLRVDGLIYSQEALEDAYDLFAECVCQLCHDGVAYEDDLAIHVARLAHPGLVRRADRLIYDGWQTRLDAVEAVVAAEHLAAVPALEASLREGTPALRASAARALGALGSASAVTVLVDHLSDSVRVDHRTVGAWAGEALAQLGEAELAADVFAALGGTPLAGWVGRVEHRREAVLVAIVRALETDAWRHALRALVEMQANEVLPALRELHRISGSRSARGQLLATVIETLEGQSALPRPAGAPPPRYDTLPKSAGDAEPDRSDLPKPAAAGEE